MTPLQERLLHVRDTLPPEVGLVAVSKFHPVAALREAYAVGQRMFGESRVQELVEKQKEMPDDVNWHFIGHLQLNKVKYIAPFVSLIHSVDSDRLLAEINRQGARRGRRIPCLLQLHVACEKSKYGFTPDAAREYLLSQRYREYPHVELCGVMCMASFTDQKAQIADEFARARQFFDWAKATCFADTPHFALRSWGMSGDYPIATQQGSNLVRVGTSIFGERQNV